MTGTQTMIVILGSILVAFVIHDWWGTTLKGVI